MEKTENDSQARALAFLRGRRASSGIESLLSRERTRRAQILARLEDLVVGLKDLSSAAWSEKVEAPCESGDGLVAREEAMRWALFRKGPGDWCVPLAPDAWALVKSAAAALRWAPSAVVQLVANAAAVELATDFEGVVRQAQRLKRSPAGTGYEVFITGYEVFIEDRLGSAFDAALEGIRPYLMAGDIVNVFLRDPAFMASLTASVQPRIPGLPRSSSVAFEATART